MSVDKRRPTLLWAFAMTLYGATWAVIAVAETDPVKWLSVLVGAFAVWMVGHESFGGDE